MSNYSQNLVMLIGRLTADPELRHLSNGTAVCTFSLATTERWKDKQGNVQERTTFHECQQWGAGAESTAQYGAKGRLCTIEGSIRNERYESKYGFDKRSMTQFLKDHEGRKTVKMEDLMTALKACDSIKMASSKIDVNRIGWLDSKPQAQPEAGQEVTQDEVPF